MIRTVLGDIEPGQLGRTNYHEHIFQATPLLPGDELDNEQLSGDEIQSLKDSGFAAMVEATPQGLGRNPEAVARVSLRTGVNIVQATGAHRQDHYPVGHPLLSMDADSLTDLFVKDVNMGTSGARSGVLKAGIGYWSITAFERRVLEAVARAHGETGAPIMIHLEHGSAAFEVLDLLSVAGVRADHVALAHIDRNPDPVLHAELAAAGAYLGYDGFARHKDWPDTTLLECLSAAAGKGAGERILIGGDVARRRRYRAYGGMPGLEYLGKRIIPRLDPDIVDAVSIANPARWLSFTQRSPSPASF